MDSATSHPAPERPPSARQRFARAAHRLVHRERRGVMLALLVLMFVVAALAPSIFITVPSGHAGVLWLRFFGGTRIAGGGLGEGLHIIFPWDRIFIYDVRLQEDDETYDVLTREGLQFSIRITFRWRLNAATLPRLHQEIGPNYLTVLMVPEIGSVVRSRISQYETEELFSTRRTQIQQEIYDFTVQDERANRIGGNEEPPGGPNFVSLVDVLLKDVVLPPRLQTAIERKLEQAQISQEYVFRIEREKLESQRKLIEAQGIQAFQQTVQQGISETYLKWRGIEATLQLAASNNAKVVIIGGGGSQGLPLILNTGDNAAPGPRVGKAPADVRDADTAHSGQLSGSIDMTPPRAPPQIGPGAALGAPFAVDQAADAGSQPPLPQASTRTDETSRPRAAAPPTKPAPEFLQALGERFGYRLEPIAPASSDQVAPNARPE